MLSGCNRNESDLLSLGLIVNNPSHKVVVWLNNDPVKVFLPGHGGPIPLRLVAQKGENIVWVTVKNEDDNEDKVIVEIKEGSWLEPDKIKEFLHWETQEASDKSPTFKFSHDAPHTMDRRELDKLTLSENEALTLIKKHHAVMEEALRERSLELIGFDDDFLNKYMGSIMNIPDFYERVFEIEDYEFESLCTADDLAVVVGETSILGYNLNGGNIFRAGPLGRSSQGEMVYSFSTQSISLGYKNGEWIFLY